MAEVLTQGIDFTERNTVYSCITHGKSHVGLGVTFKESAPALDRGLLPTNVSSASSTKYIPEHQQYHYGKQARS